MYREHERNNIPVLTLMFLAKVVLHYCMLLLLSTFNKCKREEMREVSLPIKMMSTYTFCVEIGLPDVSPTAGMSRVHGDIEYMMVYPVGLDLIFCTAKFSMICR